MTKSNQAVLLTIGQSEYKALDGITMAYAQGFETLGYHAICLDLTRPDWITQFHEYEKKYSIKLALGMSGIGLDIKTNKGNLWELCKIPFINVFCDHPCYFLQRHCYPSKYVVNAYDTKDWVDFHANFIKSSNLTYHHRFFIPPPVDTIQNDDHCDQIIFPKSGKAPNELLARWNQLPSMLKKILFAARELYFSTGINEKPIHPYIIDACIQHNIHITHNLPLFCFLIAQLDDYTRRYKNTVICNEIINMPVKILGNHWDYIDKSNAKAEFIESGDFHQTDILMKNCLAVINVNPNFEHCLHDRVGRSISNGTTPITDGNQFLNQYIPEITDSVFSWEKGAIAEKVNFILTHKQYYFEKAQYLQSVVNQRFPFNKVIQEYIDVAESIAYFESPHFIPPQMNYVKHVPDYLHV